MTLIFVNHPYETGWTLVVSGIIFLSVQYCITAECLYEVVYNLRLLLNFNFKEQIFFLLNIIKMNITLKLDLEEILLQF